ncbi:MAG: hypothetical protein IKZ31_03745, partial [Lentisphaeria bacterium]|nr:hypothetical protein [Lentisphaeria bacterium]
MEYSGEVVKTLYWLYFIIIGNDANSSTGNFYHMKINQLCCFSALLRIFLAAVLLPLAVALPGSRDSLTAAETVKEKKKSSKNKKAPQKTVKPLLPKGTSFNWNSAKEISPGILYASLKTVKPRPGRFYFVRVDLSTPHLSFRTNGRAENWGKPMPDFPKRPIRTKRITVRSFLNDLQKKYAAGESAFEAVLAVNASPWTPWTAPFTHVYADPPGINISNGEIVSRRGKEGHAFIQYKDGRVDLKTVKAKDPVDDIQ